MADKRTDRPTEHEACHVTPTWKVLVGDVREQIARLPDASVQCCVTSPPYWGLRDYGVAGQIGLEPTPEDFVARLVSVFADVRRVLTDDGVLWLNLGDSYAGSGRGGDSGTSGLEGSTRSQDESKQAGRVRGSQKHAGLHENQRQSGAVGRAWVPAPAGLKQKDLVGVPWMVAFALRADGWYLRADVIWSKPNPMPESVTDRPTKAHEYVFLLSKSSRYFYDAAAIREPYVESTCEFGQGANCRSVWPIATRPYQEAHFATFPEALPERCIKAGSRLGDVVLDPFCGSGTTGQVAIQLGRSFIGIELNPAYAKLARKRIGNAAPLFAKAVS